MTTRQVPKLALAAVAAIGLYIPTLGPPMPVPCPTITYEFKPGGTGTLHMGQGQWEQTLSGSCSGTHSGSVEGADGPIEWSPTR